MATIPTIQLFRNSIIKTGRQAAIDALEAQKGFVADGGLILARYSEDGTENGVKTLLGIVRNGGGKNVQLTVIDVEGAAENLQNAINNISREKVSEEGKAITSIRQENGVVFVEFGGVAAANVSVADTSDKFTATNVEGALLEIKNSLDNAIGTGGTVEKQISDAINALNSEKSGTSTSNHITVGVGQVAGKITSVTVSDSDIASAELLGTTSDAKDKATAFGYIAKEVADREAAIKALNFGSVGGNGQVITTISQTDGKVSATAATLSADNVAFTSSDTAFTSNNVSAALDTLYTRSGDGSKVTLESAEGTESGVLKVYTIKQGGSEVGKINIPKDLVVTSGSVVKGTWNDGTFTEEESGSGTALKLVIANQEAPVYINALDLVKDHTAGNGIAISDTNEISVKKASDSEPFLTVGADGVKLSGVQAAINTAAAAATTKVEKTGEGSHITVASSKSNSDSSVTYTISESDIASATDLTTETNNRTKADKELADKLGTGVSTAATETVTAQLQALSGTSESLSGDTSVKGAKKYTDAKVEALDLDSVGGIGQVITTISQTDGQVSATAIDLTANNVKATASTGVPTAVDVAGETVSEQIASLATSIKSVSTAAAAAHTVVNAKPDGHVKVTVSSENSHDVVTITEDDIASAAALATETTNRQTQDDTIEAAVGLNADGNHVKTNGHYTKDATTVVGEIAALDTKLKEVSDTLGTGVSIAEGKTVTEQLQALSGRTGDASGVTSVEGAKKYTDGKIEELSLTPVGGNGQVITTISQTDGKVSVTAATLGAENVSASPIDSSDATVAVTGTKVSEQIASLAKSIKTVDVDVTEQLANYYTKEYIDNELLKYPTNDDAKRLANAEALDEINKLNAEVGSTTGTSKTEAIKIVQAHGKIDSITLGAFDCGTY